MLELYFISVSFRTSAVYGQAKIKNKNESKILCRSRNVNTQCLQRVTVWESESSFHL